MRKIRFKYLFILVIPSFIVCSFFLRPQLVQADIQNTTIFSDDFTDTNGVSLLDHNSNWSIEEGSSIVQNNTLYATSGTVAYISPFVLTDQCTSYNALFPLSALIDIAVRVSSDKQSNYYTFINPEDNGLGLALITPQQQTYLAILHGISPSAGWHNLKLCAIGTQITTYLDNVAVATSVDSQITQGGISRIVVGSGNYVDNFLLEANIEQLSPSPTHTSIPTLTPTPELQNGPKVSIIYPNSNSYILNNKKVTIYSSIMSKNRIKKVEFYVNNNLVCTDKKFIYSCNWKVPKGKGKTYLLSVKAFDMVGRVGISKSIMFTSK